MNINTILYLVFGASLFLFVLSVIAYKILERKRLRTGDDYEQKIYQDLVRPTAKKKNKAKLVNFYQKTYVLFTRTPFLNGYVQKIRKRLTSIHAYDEFTMRKETMKIALWTLGLLFVGVVVLVLLNRDATFVMMVLLAVVVTNGMLVDTFINRVEDRLLKQLSHLMADVRHHYHQHGMVEEAIYEAAQVSKFEVAMHAEKVYQILTSNDPQEELENYYEIAPNRFLKAFAGISFLTKEYGDKVLNNGSMYLNSLSKLTNEINLEVLRREKLSYLFKGLTAISIAPILFTKPIETWARGHFPAMDEFYSGKLGFYTKMVIFAIIWISYILLRKMQENDEGKYAAKASRTKWEKKVYRITAVKWVVDRFVPGVHTRDYFKLTRLLKTTNSPLTLEWLYVQRILLSALCFVTAVSMFFYVHHITAQDVLTAPTKNLTLFGSMSPEEAAKAMQTTQYDTRIIEQMRGVTDHLPDKITAAVKQGTDPETMSEQQVNITTARILDKIAKINSEYFKWWELLLSLLIGGVGYYAPLWLLYFYQRMREMDMQNEVDQFHAIIAMLSEIERISVENILEWMERFSAVFKTQLQICLLNYEAGADKALEELKDESTFVPFIRTVERLQLAVEKIPVRQAFDDLETERVYYLEQRKQQHERTIEEKSSWGKMIGFIPMYALVFLYLVIPLIYMSMTQMSTYFEQIKKIH